MYFNELFAKTNAYVVKVLGFNIKIKVLLGYDLVSVN